MSSRGVALRSRLRQLGTRAIVVATLRLNECHDVHAVYPGVQPIFVGHWAGLTFDADVFYQADVAGEFIEAVWMPGDAGYDQFPNLIRS